IARDCKHRAPRSPAPAPQRPRGCHITLRTICQPVRAAEGRDRVGIRPLRTETLMGPFPGGALRSGLGPACLAVALLDGLAAPARAVPVDVFFDGPSTAAEPNTRFGLSASQANSVHDGFGVPFVANYSFLGTSVGTFEIAQSFQGFSPDPPTAATNRATSSWTVENVSGSPIHAATYLV